MPRLTQIRGFTYLGALIAVSIVSVGLTLAAEVWVKIAERQKMAELVWIGNQYVHAIESYYQSRTGSVNYYPPTLQSLILDERYLGIKRHIRTLYPNPYSGRVDWSTIAASDGGVAGIQSTVEGKIFVFLYTPVADSIRSTVLPH